jgi:hypothetical protein
VAYVLPFMFAALAEALSHRRGRSRRDNRHPDMRVDARAARMR